MKITKDMIGENTTLSMTETTSSLWKLLEHSETLMKDCKEVSGVRSYFSACCTLKYVISEIYKENNIELTEEGKNYLELHFAYEDYIFLPEEKLEEFDFRGTFQKATRGYWDESRNNCTVYNQMKATSRYIIGEDGKDEDKLKEWMNRNTSHLKKLENIYSKLNSHSTNRNATVHCRSSYALGAMLVASIAGVPESVLKDWACNVVYGDNESLTTETCNNLILSYRSYISSIQKKYPKLRCGSNKELYRELYLKSQYSIWKYWKKEDCKLLKAQEMFSFEDINARENKYSAEPLFSGVNA